MTKHDNNFKDGKIYPKLDLPVKVEVHIIHCPKFSHIL